MNKKVTEFEIIDHGIDNSQMFPGCGVSYTRFDHVATGAGENAQDAFDDALEQLAMSEWEVSGIEKSDDGSQFVGERARACSVEAYLQTQGLDDVPDDCELYYYVSIRVKGEDLCAVCGKENDDRGTDTVCSYCVGRGADRANGVQS